MHFRPARIADMQQLTNLIERETEPRGDVAEAVRNIIRMENSGIELLVDNGRIIGCCGYTADYQTIVQQLLIDRWCSVIDDNTAMLLYAAVHENWQGRSWGTQLVRRAKEQAEQESDTVVGVAWCHDSPDGADVLESVGMIKHDGEPVYWHRHLDRPVSCSMCEEGCTCDAALYATSPIGSLAIEE